ncbi:MAG TPA: YiiX/YebB-like N1pC/P60 family cysteine hydrolase [Candidatus Methylomirabilis sp.]|nr:YiiX/YebB-like N1pC/P60 family cysteine hydrolase [Candidatus Methylomirabilis sp.]
MKVWISRPLITPEQVQELKRILQPGDLILERRNWYLSNGFLPGFWTHMVLYVGAAEDLERRDLATHPSVRQHLESFRRLDRHGHAHRAIEAVSAGVVFSSLEEVASADHLAVLRPRVSDARKNIAIVRAFSHYGKPYDFDFDFFSTDKVVCTELIYRSYDEFIGGEGVRFPLVRIMGRDALPADEAVRMFAQERLQDRQREAPDVKLASQLEFVLFLDGDGWAGTARPAGVEKFIRSIDRPDRLLTPGGQTAGGAGREER